MQTFTYFLTDLAEFSSEPIVLEAQKREEALTYGTRIGREMLAQMPDLIRRGWSSPSIMLRASRYQWRPSLN
jgi:hypothetical protein